MVIIVITMQTSIKELNVYILQHELKVWSGSS